MYEDLHVVVCVSSYRWIYGVKPTLIPLSNDADSSLLDNQRPAGSLVSNDAVSSLLDNQRPAGALASNDADSSLLDNQRPASLVSNDADSSLLHNQRPAGALVSKDADLLFTWQPTYQHLAVEELSVHFVSRKKQVIHVTYVNVVRNINGKVNEYSSNTLED